jgi:hypothetical protein
MTILEYLRKYKKDRLTLKEVASIFEVPVVELRKYLFTNDPELYLYYEPLTEEQVLIYQFLFDYYEPNPEFAPVLTKIGDIIGVNRNLISQLIKGNLLLDSYYGDLLLNHKAYKDNTYNRTLKTYTKYMRVFFKVKFYQWDTYPIKSMRYQTYLNIMNKATALARIVREQDQVDINVRLVDKYINRRIDQMAVPRLVVELSEAGVEARQKFDYGLIRPVFESLLLYLGDQIEANPMILRDIVEKNFEIVPKEDNNA